MPRMTTCSLYEQHPLPANNPATSSDDFAALKADIAVHGARISRKPVNELISGGKSAMGLAQCKEVWP